MIDFSLKQKENAPKKDKKKIKVSCGFIFKLNLQIRV